MATLGLAMAGSAIGGSSIFLTGAASTYVASSASIAAQLATNAAIGQFVGASVGSYVDSAVLMPLLTPAIENTSGKIPEGQHSANTEGALMSFAFGAHCKLTGNLIWTSPMIERTSTIDEGGKGGGGGAETKQYQYWRSLAYVLTDLPKGSSVDGLERVYADAKIIWRDDPDYAYTGTDIEASVVTHSRNGPTNKGGLHPEYLWLTIPSSLGETNDLTTLRSGVDLVVSGFTAPAEINNGTYKVVATEPKTASATPPRDTQVGLFFQQIRRTHVLPWPLPPVAKVAGDSITLAQTVPKFGQDKMLALNFWDGAQTTADSVIEEWEGVGNVPSYQGTAGIAIKELFLEPYGNRPPTIECHVRVDPDPLSVADAITRLMVRAGYSASEINVAGITGELGGMVIHGPSAMGTALQVILQANDAIAQEADGTVVFKDMPTTPLATIKTEDLAAGQGASDAAFPFQLADVGEHSLPRSASLTYLDHTNNLERASEHQNPPTAIGSRDVAIDHEIAMTPSEARAITARLFYDAHRSRQAIDATLPPIYSYLGEGDLVDISAFGQTFRTLITRALIGRNNIVEMSGVVRGTSTHKGSAQSITQPSERIGVPGWLTVELIPTLSLRQAEVGKFGVYVCVYMEDVNERWGGSGLFFSWDDTDYVQVDTIANEAIAGYTTGILPTTSMPGTWDEGSTVNIRLYNEDIQLESVSELEVLRGRNRASIGGEVIGYRTATLTSPGEWALSGLLRGLHGTEETISEHYTNDSVIIIDSRFTGIRFLELDPALMGENREIFLKAVPAGELEANVETTFAQLNAEIFRPAPPSALAAHNFGNQLQISWKRSSSERFSLWSDNNRRLPDELYDDLISSAEDKYEIEIYDGSTLARPTLTQDSSQLAYSNSLQTTDGFSPGDTVTFKVRARGANHMTSDAATIDYKSSLT